MRSNPVSELFVLCFFSLTDMSNDDQTKINVLKMEEGNVLFNDTLNTFESRSKQTRLKKNNI